MSEYIEFVAKTTEAALAKASEHFGLSLNRLEWEVVKVGSSGLFGFIGAKKAKVRVRPAVGSMAEDMAVLAAVVSQDLKPSCKDNAPAAHASPTLKTKATPESSARPPAPPAAKPVPAQLPAIVAPAPALASPEEAVEELEKDTGGDKDEVPLGEENEADYGEGRLEQDSATIERARQVLSRLVQPLDPQAQVEARGGARGIVLDIASKEAGIIIGRRGQHLEALRYIATRIVSHQAGRPVRLSVDTGGYYQRRREALENLARRAAAKTNFTGKSVSVGPLSASERRVVHMTLKSEPGVTTSSRGRGELKKVIVSVRSVPPQP
jgi:spoIIIJ-associated protein